MGSADFTTKPRAVMIVSDGKLFVASWCSYCIELHVTIVAKIAYLRIYQTNSSGLFLAETQPVFVQQTDSLVNLRKC